VKASLVAAGKPLLGAALAAGALAAAGCGGAGPSSAPPLPRALLAQSRPVGRGPRFQSPARGPGLGACRHRLGPRTGVHVELFAANRVVIVPSGIGTRGPIERLSGRIVAARCYGDLVTLEPTGLLLVRRGKRLRLSDLFRGWGQPLSGTRLGPFPAPAGTRVRVFVDGRRRRRAPGAVPLAPHAVIVLEVGPFVPPHVTYRFPPGI
jgi:hypothetical protein